MALDPTALLELYEYKVADLLSGREPPGGVRGVRALRAELRLSPLPASLRRRLAQSEADFRRWQAQQPQHGWAEEPGPVGQAAFLPAEARPAEPLSAHSSPGWQAPGLSPDEEVRAWTELRHLAWHRELRDELQAYALSLRSEAARPTLRVLYAVAENAERALRGLRADFAVPAEGDPLAALGDAEAVSSLAGWLAELLLSPEGRREVGQALEGVALDPFPRHPDEDVLAARLQALAQEPLGREQRWELERRLRAEFPAVRDHRERPLLRAAAGRLSKWLGEQLARRPTDLALPRRSVLYARSAGGLEQPDDGAEELTVYLGGDVRSAQWRGLKVSWRWVEDHWQLLAQPRVAGGPAGQGQLAHLKAAGPGERCLPLRVGGQRLEVFWSGDYALLRRLGTLEDTLGLLAAQARALTLLLDPVAGYAPLRTVRAAAQRLRGGRARPGDADKYRGLSPEARLDQARSAFQSLLGLSEQLGAGATAQALRLGAQGLSLPSAQAAEIAQRLEQSLTQWTHPEKLPAPARRGRLDLTEPGRFVTTELGREGAQDVLEVGLPGGRSVTLRRDHQGELVLLRPSQPPSPLRDLAVLPLPDGAVAVVRQGRLLAWAALPWTWGPAEAEVGPPEAGQGAVGARLETPELEAGPS